jgi:D-tyrosyl-tRNA(Tyr) deacylase
MIALLQRVTHAKVVVDGSAIGAIDPGLMVLLCAERNDTDKQADTLLIKLLGYRVFPDEVGKMNRSITDINGGLLLVPQFTLAANTNFLVRDHPSHLQQCRNEGVNCSAIS